MDVSEYTPRQVLEALKAQGYSEDQAHRMMKTMGPMRIPEKQGSNLAPNLAEGISAVGAGALLSGTPLGPFAKLMAQGVVGNIGSIVGADVSGTNYYDKASGAQLIADMGGSLAGGYIGGHIAEGMGKSSAAAEKALSAAAMRTAKKAGPEAVKKLVATRAAGALGGRTIGGVLGGAAGPVGSVAGATLGGYLLPKLFANADEKAADPHAGIDNSTLAALAAGGALALPMGAGVRKMVRSGAQKANDLTGTLDDANKVIPGTTIGERAKSAAQPTIDWVDETTLPAREWGVQQWNGVQANPYIGKFNNAYKNALGTATKNRNNAINLRDAEIDHTRIFDGPRSAYEALKDDLGRTGDVIGATGAGIQSASRKLHRDFMSGAR